MERLARAAQGPEITRVRTFLTSGNLLFWSPPVPTARLRILLEERLPPRLGGRVDLQVCSQGEWRGLIRGNPFPSQAREDPTHLLLYPLAATPSPGAWKRTVEAIPGPELLQRKGRGLYVYYPDGIAGSRLTPARLERCLGQSTTGRNWNTARRILQLLESTEGPEPSPARSVD
jgi:uncharacterized protein (DUF1697 family)